MDKLEDLLRVLLSRSRLLQGENRVLERTVDQLQHSTVGIHAGV